MEMTNGSLIDALGRFVEFIFWAVVSVAQSES